MSLKKTVIVIIALIILLSCLSVISILIKDSTSYSKPKVVSKLFSKIRVGPMQSYSATLSFAVLSFEIGLGKL